MKDLSNNRTADQEHVVLIAGNLTGGVRAAAFAYAREGNHIVVASGDDDAGLELTGQLRSRHIDAQFVHADIGNDAEMRALVEATTLYYGHLDVQYLQ